MTLKAVVDNAPDTHLGPREPQSTPGLSKGDEPPAMRTRIDIRSVSLTVLAGLAIVLALQYAQAMIIPIVLGVLISYALDPIVTALGRLR